MKYLATLAALASFSATAVHTQPTTWSYKTDDPSVYGPSQWGTLYPACAGQRQSPIDIQVKSRCASDAREEVLSFAGACPKYKLKQLYDAHKIESVNGTCTVTAKGKPYAFAQAHFHAPAEHTVDGKVHDGEVHFVHMGDDGAVVVGLFLQKQADDINTTTITTDPYMASFWKAIAAVTKDKPVAITLDSFFPLLRARMRTGKIFNYLGSLTNPTCDEIVEWYVLEKPLVVSAVDFDALLPALTTIEASDDGKNARPTQPLHGRTVTVY